MQAWLLGAVAPDVPLFLLTLAYAGLRRVTGTAAPGEGLYAPGFDDLFYRDPFWVTAHNVLHAPLVIGLMAAAGWYAWRRQREWGLALVWFAAGCALHTGIDTFTHTRDGPLLLFPLDWSYRFRSSLSYWQPDHYGAVASRLELGLDVAILGYFAVWWLGRARHGQA